MIDSRHEGPLAPQVAIGAVVIRNKQILLVKRKKEPGRGLWAIPGGSVQIGETLQEAAEREVLEETGLVVKAKQPIYLFDYIERDERNQVRFHYVIIDLEADLTGGRLCAADDALDARWFSPEEIRDTPITENTRRFLRKIEFVS